jgi:integrase
MARGRMMNALKKALKDYVAFKRAMGLKFRDEERSLESFLSFMKDRRATRITSQLAYDWATQPKKAQAAYWARRLGDVRRFASYLQAYVPDTEIPPDHLIPGRSRRAKPYLYSHLEIRQLMAAARDLSPGEQLPGLSYHCLIGLLATTGLRVGEALNLKRDDVDLDHGTLTIRAAKFNKSRLVPLHRSTIHALRRYAQRRDALVGAPRRAHFLVAQRGGRLWGPRVRTAFNKASRRIGLRKPDDSRGPRLHDFRHRFAVEALRRWYRRGKDVENLLPVLSTYLGHVNIQDTYWYLSACPELMSAAAKRLDKRWEIYS